MSNSIDIGSGNVCAAIESNIPVALVVSKNDNQIRIGVLSQATDNPNENDNQRSKRKTVPIKHKRNYIADIAQQKK